MMFDHPELFTPYGRMKEQESYDIEWRRGKMEIIGQVVKIQTTADMCVRIVIDADKDAVPADVFTALNETALVRIDKEESKNG